MPINKKRVIEQRYNTPIEHVLADLLERLGRQSDVAAQLGVRQSTVSRWLREHGLEAQRGVKVVMRKTLQETERVG